MIIQDFTRIDFKKSGISDITLEQYCNGYLIDAPDYWQLKYPQLYKNEPTDYFNKRLKNSNGNKYVKPKDICSRLFRPLALSPNVISNRNEYIIITEGEKKAIKAVQEGFNCIALAGVWAWKQKPKEDNDTENYELNADIIPDICNADFKNKVIYLCYDNDMWEKPQVKEALYHFSSYLIAEKQAFVKIIELPKDDKKLGLDDYLIKYGNISFQELLDNAEDVNLNKIQTVLSDKMDARIEFPVDIFPKDIQKLTIDLHKRLDAPLEYIACTILVTVSMLMDYRFMININPSSNWIEHPILWCALVGKPSQKKTPCLKIGKDILDKLEDKLQNNYEEKLEDYNKKLIQYKAELEAYKTSIRQGKNAIIPNEPKKPLKPHLQTQNTTVEALAMAISNNSEVNFGVGLFVDELSHFLKSYNLYKNGEGNDKEYYMQSWNKNRQNILRKGNNEDFTITASHNIVGGIQPKVLDETLFAKGIDSYDGMLERWLFCCTDYVETGMLPDFKENYTISAFEDCCKKIFEYPHTPKMYKLDNDAHEEYKDICKRIAKKNELNSLSGLLKSYIIKQRSYIARFALVLHCMENIDNPEISLETLNNSVKLSRYFTKCFRKLMDEKIATNPLEEYTLTFLRTKGIKTISPTELRKKNTSRYKTLEMAKITLESLAGRGFGRICKSGSRGTKFIFYG